MFLFKYLNSGSNIKDNIDLFASGKHDLIAMDLQSLRKHLEQNPKDGYFFFNPHANLKDVTEIDFGFCKCQVDEEKPLYGLNEEGLRQNLDKDIRDLIIRDAIAQCHLNDDQSLKKAIVLVNLPEDITNLPENFKNKIEIMSRKPELQKTLKVDCVGTKKNFSLKIQQSDETLNGFYIYFIDDVIYIKGIVKNNPDNYEFTKSFLFTGNTYGFKHMTLNIVKSKIGPTKNFLSGSIHKTTLKELGDEETELSLKNMAEYAKDITLFIVYSINVTKDTLEVIRDKIGIIRDGIIYDCEHLSNQKTVVYQHVLSPAEFLTEQSKIQARERTQEKATTKEEERNRIIAGAAVGTTTVAFGAYVGWQVFKWVGSLSLSPFTGGASLGLAIATP